MFRKLHLTFHLFILYGVLGISLLSLCSYCLFVISDYDKTIHTLDRDQLPLARIIAEISRHQLDQTLRFSELLLFSRINDREKFEISNEGYIQAGKRLLEEVEEGKMFSQKAMDMAESTTRSTELDAIKTLLKGIEKAHGDYEHVGELLIREIYQNDFLLKNEWLVSGDLVAAEEATTKYISLLKTNISSLEDETHRLEGVIKETVERVKQLSQFLAIDARNQKNRTTNGVLFVLFFVLSVGFLLVFAIASIQKQREKNKNSLTSQALALLSDTLTQLQTNFQKLESSSTQLEKSFIEEKDSFGDAMSNLQKMMYLSEENRQLSEQITSLNIDKNRALKQTNLLVNQLNEDAGKMLESEVETGRIIRNLKATVGQINLLATNASAEASRLGMGGSFSVFTEEIKNLSQAVVLVVEKVMHRMDDSIKGIHSDRLHAIRTHQQFSEVVEIARHEVDLLEKNLATTQKVHVLHQGVQRVVTGVNKALQTNVPLLDQMKTSRDLAKTQVESARDAVGGWFGVNG